MTKLAERGRPWPGLREDLDRLRRHDLDLGVGVPHVRGVAAPAIIERRLDEARAGAAAGRAVY